MRTADKPLHINVARIVRSLMAARGFDQMTVCEAIGVGQPSLSKRLGGHTPWTLEDIASLADLFGVSEAIFFADSGELFSAVDASSVRRAAVEAPRPRSARGTKTKSVQGVRMNPCISDSPAPTFAFARAA